MQQEYAEDLVFYVDLNELEDGVITVVSMDYTTAYGPGVWVRSAHIPQVEDWVRLYSEDDDTLYFGQVVERLSDRDLRVRIEWDTCTSTSDVPVQEHPFWKPVGPRMSDARISAERDTEANPNLAAV